MITKNARIFSKQKNSADNCDEIESIFVMKKEKRIQLNKHEYASRAQY